MVRNLVALGVPRDIICVDPLVLMPEVKHYTELLFQFYVTRPGERSLRGGELHRARGLMTPAGPNAACITGGEATLVAAGGRYDGLLQSTWEESAAPGTPPGAVGASINVSLLAHLLEESRREAHTVQHDVVASSSQARPRRKSHPHLPTGRSSPMLH